MPACYAELTPHMAFMCTGDAFGLSAETKDLSAPLVVPKCHHVTTPAFAGQFSDMAGVTSLIHLKLRQSTSFG